MKHLLLRSLALAAFLSPRLFAQTATADLPVGALLPDGRHVAEVLQVALDDDGRRLAWLWAGMGDGKLLLRDDEILAERAQPLAEPPGTSLGEVGQMRFDRAGNAASLIGLLGAGPLRGSALFWRERLVAQKGETPTFEGAPPGMDYSAFGTPHPSAGAVLVTVNLRDPRDPLTQNFLVRFALGAEGEVLSSERVLGRGDVPVGTDDAVARVLVDSHTVDANERGDWSAKVALDSAGYALLHNGAVVAAHGAPSTVPGRAYDLAGHVGKLDLNDQGQLAFTALLGQDDDAILVDGSVFVRAGDVIDGLTLHAFAEYPVALSNSGDLYWAGITADEEGTLRAAYFRNRTAILVEGLTSVEGRLVTHVHPGEDEDPFIVSASGRFWGGWAVLEGLGRTLVRMDFGAAVPVAGCQPNPGSLRIADGLALAGRTVALELDGAPAAGMSATLILGAPLASDCGLALPFGELLVGPGLHLGIAAGVFTGSALSVPIAIPADPSLVDLELSLQGVFLDPAHTLPGPDVRLTNALRLEIGAF